MENVLDCITIKDNIGKIEDYSGSVISVYKKLLSDAGSNIGFDEHSMKIFKKSIDNYVVNTNTTEMYYASRAYVLDILIRKDERKISELSDFIKSTEIKPLKYYKKGEVIFADMDEEESLQGADAQILINNLYKAFSNGIVDELYHKQMKPKDLLKISEEIGKRAITRANGGF